MYNANTLAHVILAHARRTRRWTADDKRTVLRLMPRLSGVVWVLATLAMRYYTVVRVEVA